MDSNFEMAYSSSKMKKSTSFFEEFININTDFFSIGSKTNSAAMHCTTPVKRSKARKKQKNKIKDKVCLQIIGNLKAST